MATENIETLNEVFAEKEKEDKPSKRNIICMDIETIPADDVDEFIPDYILESFNPRKHVKFHGATKKETVERKIAEAKAAYPTEQKKKIKEWKETAGLKAHSGQIAIIGTLTNGTLLQQPNLRDVSEREMLLWWKNFYNEEIFAKDGILITFNGKSFDMPFIKRRMWKHGIYWKWDADDEKWGKGHKDLMYEWAKPNAYGHPDFSDRVSADVMYKFFGLKGKIMKGSDFANAWFNGDREKPFRYNADELYQMYEVAKIMLNIK